MRRFVLSVLAFGAAMLLSPLASAQTVGVPLQMRTGDSFTVNVEYTQTSNLGEQEFDARMSYVYSVHVLDAEQRLWRFMPISMGYEFPEVPGIDTQAVSSMNWAAISDAISAMMRIGTDVGFECRVDEHGRCIEMTNWPFWSTRVENMVLFIDAVARAAPSAAAAPTPTSADGMAPAPDWNTLRGPVLQGVARLIDGFDSRDAAASMSSIYLPAFVQGRTLTRRQRVNFVDEYEMPWGAPPLRYTGTIVLDRINRRDNTGVVVRRATLDQASVRTSLRAMTEFVSDAVVEPLAAYYPDGEVPDGAGMADMIDMMLADLSYEETTTGIVDLSTGMARETTTEFSVSARMVSSETPVTTRGRIVTRVTPTAQAAPRLPRN